MYKTIAKPLARKRSERERESIQKMKRTCRPLNRPALPFAAKSHWLVITMASEKTNSKKEGWKIPADKTSARISFILGNDAVLQPTAVKS